MKRVAFALLIFMAGCAIWQPTAGLYTAESQNFSVELPKGWMRLNTSDYLLTTRDGVLLQKIVVNRVLLTKEKQFEHTKKKVTREMIPQEVAEVVMDDLQSDPSALNTEIEENRPATVGGMPGFKLTYAFKTKEGLKSRGIAYGFISGEWLYEIFYLAPQRYYFDKDKDTFEKVLLSFKLIKTM